MKRKLLILGIIVIAILIFVFYPFFLKHNTKDISSKHLIAEYRNNYDYLKVYQENNDIILYASSDSKFGNSVDEYKIKYNEPITKKNITVIWEGIMHEPLKQGSKETGFVHVIIKKDSNLIYEGEHFYSAEGMHSTIFKDGMKDHNYFKENQQKANEGK